MDTNVIQPIENLDEYFKEDLSIDEIFIGRSNCTLEISLASFAT